MAAVSTAGVAGASCTPAYSGPPAALGLPPAGVAPGPAQSVGSQLLETLSMDLEMTKEQVEKLANQKQVIRSDRETVSQCLQLVEQLRQKISAHMSAAQSITNQLRQILTPVQVAKFLMWVEKNKRSMDLLNTIGGSE